MTRGRNGYILPEFLSITSPWTVVHQALCPWGFSGQEYWSGLLCLPPGDLPNPGIEPWSPALRWILYHLSNQESPRILEWIAYPFSKGSFLPRNQTRVCCIAGGFFTRWATREALYLSKSCNFSVLLDIWENLREWVFVISFTFGLSSAERLVQNTASSLLL